MNRLLLPVALALLALFALACPGERTTCTTSEDCAGAFVCIDVANCDGDDDDSSEAPCEADRRCLSPQEAEGYYE